MSNYSDKVNATYNMFQFLGNLQDQGYTTIEEVMEMLKPEILEGIKKGCIAPTGIGVIGEDGEFHEVEFTENGEVN